MILFNSTVSLLICLATAADLVMLANLRRGGSFRLSGIACSLFLSVAYLANIFAMHAHLYTFVAPTEIVCNLAVLGYQARRTWVLILLSSGHHDHLPEHLRQKI